MEEWRIDKGAEDGEETRAAKLVIKVKLRVQWRGERKWWRGIRLTE